MNIFDEIDAISTGNLSTTGNGIMFRYSIELIDGTSEFGILFADDERDAFAYLTDGLNGAAKVTVSQEDDILFADPTDCPIGE